MFDEELFQQISQFPDGTLVVRIADIDDLVLADIVAVFQNAQQRRNAVVDIGKALFRLPPSTRLIGRFIRSSGDELRHHPGAALLSRIQGIQAGPTQLKGRNSVNSRCPRVP